MYTGTWRTIHNVLRTMTHTREHANEIPLPHATKKTRVPPVVATSRALCANFTNYPVNVPGSSLPNNCSMNDASNRLTKTEKKEPRPAFHYGRSERWGPEA